MDDSAKSHQAACSHCCQDIIRNCHVCMYPGDDGRCLYEPLKKLLTAGAQAGLEVETMVEILNSGLSVLDLVSYIESRGSEN